MRFSAALKNARAAATQAIIAGGRIDICTAGASQVLASLPITAARVENGDLMISLRDAMALGDGAAATACIVAGDGTPAIDGLSVGDNASAADIKFGTARFSIGTRIMLPEFVLR